MTSTTLRAKLKRSRSTLSALPSTTCAGQTSTRKRKKTQKNRVPAWAEYFYDGPDYRDEYLAHKQLDLPQWSRYKRAAKDGYRKRKAAIDAGGSTPAKVRALKRNSLEAFVQRANRRPLSNDDNAFAAQIRARNPEIALLTPKSQQRAIKREHAKKRRKLNHIETHHTTHVTASELNVPLLRSWFDLKLDRTPRITQHLLDLLEGGADADARLEWCYWRSEGMGRLFAEPWESLASMNRDARAVLCFERNVLDLDMSCCHHRIALEKGIRYGVEDLEPLRRYVADPKKWRTEIEREACVGAGDAKMLGVVLLNLGGLGVWCQASEFVPQLSTELRTRLEAFRACCLRIRDATLLHEQDTFPASLQNACRRRRWSFSLCATEDRALCAIWQAVHALGARVVMLVYDGLMLIPGPASRDALADAATLAATQACGIQMPTRFKEMKLPEAMNVILRKDREIAKLSKQYAGSKRTVTHLRDMIEKLTADRE
jgi:hypothetical protein